MATEKPATEHVPEPSPPTRCSTCGSRIRDARGLLNMGGGALPNSGNYLCKDSWHDSPQYDRDEVRRLEQDIIDSGGFKLNAAPSRPRMDGAPKCECGHPKGYICHAKNPDVATASNCCCGGYHPAAVPDDGVREPDLHAAICEAVALMNRGLALPAHDVLRKVLVDYADAAHGGGVAKDSHSPVQPIRGWAIISDKSIVLRGTAFWIWPEEDRPIADAYRNDGLGERVMQVEIRFLGEQ